jgi:HD-GYP domain-containing protein (c-di-GMP phosphodiesterase class II)
MDAPLGADRFRALAEAWSGSGMWLSVWDCDGACVLRDPSAPRFWNMLWSAGSSFRDRLAVLVLEGMDEATKAQSGEATKRRSHEEDPTPATSRAKTTRARPPLTDLRPVMGEQAVAHGAANRRSHKDTRGRDAQGSSRVPPGLDFVLAPIRRRHRVVGAILAVGLIDGYPDESLHRLCHECGLDVTVLRGLAVKAVVHPAVVAQARNTLPLAVNLSGEADLAREETSALTHNLESTYEELHLIYSIGGKLSFAHPPSHVLGLVSGEVLEVSRAAAVAFVLAEVDSDGGPPNIRAGLPMPVLGDRIVQRGAGAPTLHDLDRLVECLRLQPDSLVGHIVYNQATGRPELGWAAGWLEHVVALPLWHERKLLGVMLAINCNDAGDFTSVDVQFLRAVADRVAPFLANRRLYDDLGELLMGMLHALVNSIDAKDTYTCGHSERVAFISRALAQAAGLSAAECERIYLAGLLHDVGKIGVPDNILCKTGKLTAEEFAVMQKHPEIGVRILAGVRQIRDLLPGVMHHHERMDGRGYPEGRSGEDIPLLGRIICIADCFDAMTTNRTYRAAMPLPVAVAEVRRCAGTQFDPALAEVFLKLDHVRMFDEARAMCTGEDVLDGVRHIQTRA